MSAPKAIEISPATSDSPYANQMVGKQIKDKLR